MEVRNSSLFLFLPASLQVRQALAQQQPARAAVQQTHTMLTKRIEVYAQKRAEGLVEVQKGGK